MANSGDRVIVEISMRDFQRLGQCFFLDCEAMILSRDLDSTARHIQDWLVRAAMAELQLERFRATG